MNSATDYIIADIQQLAQFTPHQSLVSKQWRRIFRTWYIIRTLTRFHTSILDWPIEFNADTIIVIAQVPEIGYTVSMTKLAYFGTLLTGSGHKSCLTYSGYIRRQLCSDCAEITRNMPMEHTYMILHSFFYHMGSRFADMAPVLLDQLTDDRSYKLMTRPMLTDLLCNRDPRYIIAASLTTDYPEVVALINSTIYRCLVYGLFSDYDGHSIGPNMSAAINLAGGPKLSAISRCRRQPRMSH